MRSILSKSLLVSIALSSSLAFAFTDSECLSNSFNTVVSHKAFPFGLTDTTLDIKKDGCIIEINHSKLKYYNRKWVIDVCRGPIHIKYGTGTVDVYKRLANCRNTKTPSEYCKHLQELELLLQDDGLIFAPGDKDVITDDHGRVYCTYMLSLAYLEKGLVFNRNQHYENVLTRGIYKTEITESEGKPLLSLPTSKQLEDTKAIAPVSIEQKEALKIEEVKASEPEVKDLPLENKEEQPATAPEEAAEDKSVIHGLF